MSTTQPTLDRNRTDSGHPAADTPHWNTVLCGDCAEVLTTVAADTVDLVIADPPYLVNYRPRDGRSYLNDDNERWLRPAFAEVFRVCVPMASASVSTAGLGPIISSRRGVPPASARRVISCS